MKLEIMDYRSCDYSTSVDKNIQLSNHLKESKVYYIEDMIYYNATFDQEYLLKRSGKGA